MKVPGGGGGAGRAGVGGAQAHYQEDLQQPRPVPLNVKGGAVGQRHDGSCDRRVGVGAAGPGPTGKQVEPA